MAAPYGCRSSLPSSERIKETERLIEESGKLLEQPGIPGAHRQFREQIDQQVGWTRQIEAELGPLLYHRDYLLTVWSEGPD